MNTLLQLPSGLDRPQK